MTDTEGKDIVSVARDIVDREMVIGPDDIEPVKKFFDHFSIEMPEELKKSMGEFKNNPNLKTQKRFVIEVNRAISGENSIESLDEMFKPIVECAKETAYDLEFNDEIGELLREDGEDLDNVLHKGSEHIREVATKTRERVEAKTAPQESQTSSEQEPSDS